MPQEHPDAAYVAPLRSLASMAASDCVPLPPRRVAMEDGYECLIEWRPARHPDQWRLDLTKRATSVDDRESPVQKFGAAISLGESAPAVSWEGSDTGFAEWLKTALPEIVAETERLQSVEQGKIKARAQIGRSGLSVRDFIPHIVIVIALAAFAYMFAIVHIKF